VDAAPRVGLLAAVRTPVPSGRWWTNGKGWHVVDEVVLEVRRLDPEVPLPSYAHPGDAGLDLAAASEVELAPGARVAVPTGLAVAIPAGWVGLVHPRSGLARRRGVTVTNAPGTIDAGYRGEVQVLLVNLGQEPVVLRRGDRVAQLLLQRVGTARVVEVDELDDTPRGAGGFGSTGGTTTDR
jgi:dUTP pyrophosphatase